MIREACQPIAEISEVELGPLLDQIADARVVLLGEASHRTSELYRMRTRTTNELVMRRGFNIVAIEGDWPDAARIDQHVCGLDFPAREDPPSTRFPTWMWRNREVLELVAWLKSHNELVKDPEQRVGFYGLDLYSLYKSLDAVLHYLNDVDPKAAKIAKERYACLSPWERDPALYGRAAISRGYAECERPVVGVLRDQHMFDTLERLLEFRGSDAKAVVGAHNSHVGDARATEMGAARGEHNTGQLCRQRFGDGAFSVGFGTHAGTIAAATNWDGPMEIKKVRPSHPSSYECLCHDIGVIYRPGTELQSHYFQAALPVQFNAYVWFDETSAVHPLEPGPARADVPAVYR